MIQTKTNHYIRKTLISMAVLGMAFFLLGCYKQQTQGEAEEFVANTVPEKAKLVGYEEQQSKSGTVYCYIFKSESRDLEFRVFSSRGGGAIGGYYLTQYYDVGRDNYYLEKMRPYLTSCENSEMYVKSDADRVSQKMYLEDEADARAIAGVLAECNTIVTEQWHYQPGADLTSRDVVGISFYFYPSTDAKGIIGKYELNGKDDEDKIYNELVQMLNFK